MTTTHRQPRGRLRLRARLKRRDVEALRLDAMRLARRLGVPVVSVSVRKVSARAR